MIGKNRVAGNQTINIQNEVRVDEALILSLAASKGFVDPSEAQLLHIRLQQAEATLAELKETGAGVQVDQIIGQINAGDMDAADTGFRRLHDSLASGDGTASAKGEAEAQALFAHATLIYSGDAVSALPLLERAVDLVPESFRYLFGLAQARTQLGDGDGALALVPALRLAAARDERPLNAAFICELINLAQAERQGRHQEIAVGVDLLLEALTRGAWEDEGEATSAAMASILLRRKAEAFLALERPGEACDALREAYLRAVAAYEADPQADANYGRYAMELGRVVANQRAEAGDPARAKQEIIETIGLGGRVLEGCEPGSDPWSRVVGEMAEAFPALAMIEDQMGDRDAAAKTLAGALHWLAQQLQAAPEAAHIARAFALAAVNEADYLLEIDEKEAAWTRYARILPNFRDGWRANPEDRELACAFWRVASGLAERDPVKNGALWQDVVDAMVPFEAEGTLSAMDQSVLARARHFLEGIDMLKGMVPEHLQKDLF